MPKHIVRLIFALAVFGAVAFAAKAYFTAPSFYLYGHYRGDSVAEIAADKPLYQGADSCRGCHAGRYAQWSAGVHNQPQAGKSVACETCHGAGAGHPVEAKLRVPAGTASLCSRCHERAPGRPAAQPQVVAAEHAAGRQCASCHEPHSPRIARAGAPAAAAQAGTRTTSSRRIARETTGWWGRYATHVGAPAAATSRRAPRARPPA